MNQISKIYYILYNRLNCILYNKLLRDKNKRKKLEVLCVFMFGCVCGFVSKFVGKEYKGQVEIRNKLALLDKKREELVELHNNLEGVKKMINELKEQLEEKKINC